MQSDIQDPKDLEGLSTGHITTGFRCNQVNESEYNVKFTFSPKPGSTHFVYQLECSPWVQAEYCVASEMEWIGYYVLTLDRIESVTPFFFTKKVDDKTQKYMFTLSSMHSQKIFEEDMDVIQAFQNFYFSFCKPGQSSETAALVIPRWKGDTTFNIMKLRKMMERVPGYSYCRRTDTCIAGRVGMTTYNPALYPLKELNHDLSPASTMDESTKTTYIEYYGTKWNLAIQDPKQPLLETLPNRQVFFLPATKRPALKHKSNRDRGPGPILIPELCFIYPNFTFDYLTLSEVVLHAQKHLSLLSKFYVDTKRWMTQHDFILSNFDLLKKVFTSKAFAVSREAQEPSSSHNEPLDSVLDFVVSYNLFWMFPHLDEVELTVLRAKLIRNQYLAKCGERLSLNSFLLIIGDKPMKEQHPKYQDRANANLFEAYLGALFQMHGLLKATEFCYRNLFIDDWFDFLLSFLETNEKRRTIMNSSELIPLTQFGHPFPISWLDKFSEEVPILPTVKGDELRRLEKELFSDNLHFGLLVRSITAQDIKNQPNHESLAFLGNSLIKFLTAVHIFSTYKDLDASTKELGSDLERRRSDEEVLTLMRSYQTTNAKLSHLTKILELEKHAIGCCPQNLPPHSSQEDIEKDTWKSKKEAVTAKKGYTTPSMYKWHANFFSAHVAVQLLQFGLEEFRNSGQCECSFDVGSHQLLHSHLFQIGEGDIDAFDARLYHAFQKLHAPLPKFKVVPANNIKDITDKMQEELSAFAESMEIILGDAFQPLKLAIEALNAWTEDVIQTVDIHPEHKVVGLYLTYKQHSAFLPTTIPLIISEAMTESETERKCASFFLKTFFPLLQREPELISFLSARFFSTTVQ